LSFDDLVPGSRYKLVIRGATVPEATGVYTMALQTAPDPERDDGALGELKLLDR
jgi:hypothetical protein